MVHEQDNLVVGREELIADGEAKDDAALLVSDCNRHALHVSRNLLANCML